VPRRRPDRVRRLRDRSHQRQHPRRRGRPDEHRRGPAVDDLGNVGPSDSQTVQNFHRIRDRARRADRPRLPSPPARPRDGSWATRSTCPTSSKLGFNRPINILIVVLDLQLRRHRGDERSGPSWRTRHQDVLQSAAGSHPTPRRTRRPAHRRPETRGTRTSPASARTGPTR